MVSSLRSGMLAKSLMARKSGTMAPALYKTSLVTLPIIVTLVTLCFFNVEIIFPILPILMS